MGKINNTSTYAISAPVVATDIVIGSALGVGGDTKNFLMSDISAYVIGNVTVPTLNQVCASGNVTSTSLDINNTADISGTLTLSKPTGTGLQVTSDASIGGTLTVNTTASFTDAGSSISASGLISTAGNILALGTIGGAFLLTDSANAPASAAAAGTAGSIVADANYIYVCTATNTWKRVAIATW